MTVSGCLATRHPWNGQPLHTARLTLRLPEESDVADLVEQAGDWEVARWMATVPHPYSPADAATFIASVRQAHDFAQMPSTFVIIERDSQQLVGVATLDDRPDADSVAYWIGRAHWGKGYATEVVRRLLAFGFRDLGMDQATTTVMPGNQGSVRVLEKAGLTFDQTVTGGKGRCADLAVERYVIARADWLAAEDRKPTVLVSAVALVDDDGRVLLAQRPAGKAMGGLWEFPGGKVEAGETPETALVRELKEELGIDISESCLAAFSFASYPYDHFHLLMPLFVCRTWKGQLHPHEGQVLTWVKPMRLGDYDMPPADIPLVAMLQDFL